MVFPVPLDMAAGLSPDSAGGFADRDADGCRVLQLWRLRNDSSICRGSGDSAFPPPPSSDESQHPIPSSFRSPRETGADGPKYVIPATFRQATGQRRTIAVA